MAVQIRLKGGPYAGSLQQFGDDVPRITLGRDPNACQVVVALPGDTTVGREHCAIVRVGDTYRLADLGDHLVTVNETPFFEGDELPVNADLRLGPGGPELVVNRCERTCFPKQNPKVGASQVFAPGSSASTVAPDGP